MDSEEGKTWSVSIIIGGMIVLAGFGIAKWMNSSNRTNSLEAAALKVDTEKQFLKNPTIFQYKAALFKHMDEQVGFWGDISRKAVISCMQNQLKGFVMGLPVEQEKWSESDHEIYNYAAKTLIDYINSDKSGKRFFHELRKEILDYKVKKDSQYVPKPHELPLTHIRLNYLRNQKEFV